MRLPVALMVTGLVLSGCGENGPNDHVLPVGDYLYGIAYSGSIVAIPFPSGHLVVEQATPDSLAIRWNLEPDWYPDTLQVAHFNNEAYEVSVTLEDRVVAYRFWRDGDNAKCRAIFTPPYEGVNTFCQLERIN